MIYEAFDVVVVPFPFTDRATTKRRPALILSDAAIFNRPVGQAVMAMITSARNSDWPLDVEIEDLDAAGLPAPSIVRMKLFTLDEKLVLRKAGALVGADRGRISSVLRKLLQSHLT
ncbi:type II toxin-antitoxin system PemK/MazF family toxin [Geoalkalibacter subterraneus]|uniref:Transcriptional regulator n=1 Tax=Geoalkalibacter subterraneus TaxID=483547 RepID=A0A0B5FHK1_9BACT|nr:type II toxin-antitoxin system PemK/MazF family toxin [Geoalkalibacter subterraneus]AJF07667.1 transcriptional regulator [Geoalkalibacter subterraneus]